MKLLPVIAAPISAHAIAGGFASATIVSKVCCLVSRDLHHTLADATN
jgi:hypothetical protein